MDVNSSGSPEKVLEELIGQLRTRLLALQKARIVGAKLAATVSQLLPDGQSYRDLLPAHADRETASFRQFVEWCLSDAVVPTAERRGSDILYDIVGSGQEVIPEPGELWRAFVAVRPKLHLVLDQRKALLSAVPHPAQVSSPRVVLSPLSLAEHREICNRYLRQLSKQGTQVPQLEEVLADYTASSYAKWLKILRGHAPPLDREWGEFRKNAVLEIFEQRVNAFELGGEKLAHLMEQFAKDTPGADRDPAQSSDATAVQSSPPELLEGQVRRRLHAVIDRMTLEQMNALLIPFSLFPQDPN